MENFVVNLFADQLSKIILNFHDAKLKINANFLSGKGSITNLRLNVDVINEFLNKPPHAILPCIQFSEILITELRVEVTSYTNLKKAPVVLVIEEIRATIVEPLEYHSDATNNAHANNKNKNGANDQVRGKGNAPPPRNQPAATPAYGLLHRIIDNLSVRINRINITFQSLGKFKTNRFDFHRWTPPPVIVCLENVEYISITETGHHGSPDQVWAHNELWAQQSKLLKRDVGTTKKGGIFHHRSYVIYKRLSMVCHVRLVTPEQHSNSSSLPQSPSPKSDSPVEASGLISDCQVEVHVAYVRRLRDAAVTGIDVDVLCHDVNVNLDATSSSKSGGALSSFSHSACDLGAFVHMLAGLQFCMYKDRAFVDPLFPRGHASQNGNESSLKLSEKISLSEEKGSIEQVESDSLGEGEDVGPDAFLPSVSLIDDDLDSTGESDVDEEPDEEHDEAFLAWKKEQEVKEGILDTKTDDSDDPFASLVAEQNSNSNVPSDGNESEAGTGIKNADETNPSTQKYKKKRRPVLVLASGAQKFENLSFSFTVQKINAKLYMPNDNDNDHRHCLEFLMEGLVSECIWPKVSGEMGGHVQCSLSYIHIMESVQRIRDNAKKNDATNNGDHSSAWTTVKMHPLLRMGTRLFQGHDVFSLSSSWKGSWFSEPCVTDTNKCDEFPLMEKIQTSWKWERPKGRRALALKSTVSFVDEKLTLWSKTNVQHEASLSEIEVILDSSPLGRLAMLFSASCKNWYDERWFSGDWSTDINMGMIAANESNGAFHLKNYLQPLPAWFSNGKLNALSSDLRSVTAHIGPITVRVPNPLNANCFLMADIAFRVSEATILVSSDLPKSFLSGTWITPSENSVSDFPNSPSDPSCVKDLDNQPTEVTKFACQIVLKQVLCNHSLFSHGDENDVPDNLLAPTNVTLMMNLENKGDTSPTLGEACTSSQVHTSQSLILSVLIQHLELNLELRSLYGALETIKYHLFGVIRQAELCASRNIVESTAVENSLASHATGNSVPKNQQRPSVTMSVVCVHLPDVEIKLWSNRVPSTHSSPLMQHVLLCRLKAKQIEFGTEASTLSICRKNHVHKCGISGLSLEICKSIPLPTDGSSMRNKATLAQNTANMQSEMIEILLVGDEKAEHDLINNVCAFCSCGVKDNMGIAEGVLLRLEGITEVVHAIAHDAIADNTPLGTSFAVDVTSPVTFSLDINAIRNCLDLVADSFTAPIFVSARSRVNQYEDAIISQYIGSALVLSVTEISAAFSSSSTINSERTGDNDARTKDIFAGLFLSRILVVLPRSDDMGVLDRFGLLFSESKIAYGQCESKYINTEDGILVHQHLVNKHCGHGGQTWRPFFNSLGRGKFSSFYVISSKQTLINIGCPKLASNDPNIVSRSSHQLSVVIPTFEIDWSSLLIPKSENSSDTGSLEAIIMKELVLSLIRVGKTFSSSSNLSRLSKEHERCSFSSAARCWHESMGNYHLKMIHLVRTLSAEVSQYKHAIFFKERDRLGALALVSSTASGWVRVGEGSSFSHRIFSSATLWRYWMVLDKSVLILYTEPCCISPSFVIPLSASTDLRNISSSSNKMITGIVGNHLQQRGFAIVEPMDGTELFFVVSNQPDYNMWVSAISGVLKKGRSLHKVPIAEDNVKPTYTIPVDTKTEVVNACDQPVEILQCFARDLGELEGALGGASCDGNNTSFVPDIDDESNDDVLDTISLSDNLVKVGNETQEGFSKSKEEIPLQVSLPEMSIQPLPNHHEQQSMQSVPSYAEQQPILDSAPEQINNRQPSLMRDRLSKGKSRFANAGSAKNAKSLFGSALKTAKGGVLAAGEIGREGIKQALAKEEQVLQSANKGQNRQQVPMHSSSRPIAGNSGLDRPIAVGQKMSVFKQKLGTAVRSSLQEHSLGHDSYRQSNSTLSDRPSERSEVFQEHSFAEETEQSFGETDKDIFLHLNSTQAEPPSAGRSAKQELRKKFVNLDQSMSNTMRRLKIDEKMTQIGAAVKSANESNVMRSLSNASSKVGDQPKHRIGIGEEVKPSKTIKFDARETFSSFSELPVKVKSIRSGDALCLLGGGDGYSGIKLCQSSEGGNVKSRIKGCWAVSVKANSSSKSNAIGSRETSPDNMNYSFGVGNNPVAPAANDDEECHNLKYEINCTDIGDGAVTCATISVERSVSDILIFHTLISEILANKLSHEAEFVCEKTVDVVGNMNRTFSKMSNLERLRVSGTLLQNTLSLGNRYANNSSSLQKKYCDLIKMFVYTLLESHLPEEATPVIEDFLGIASTNTNSISDIGGVCTKNISQSVDCGLNAISPSVGEAFEHVPNFSAAIESQPATPSLDNSQYCSEHNHELFSSVINTMMKGYTKAVKERDEALASLATASTLHDHRIIKEQMSKSKNAAKQASGPLNSQSGMAQNDDDMLMLCKQLGNEISLKTSAEIEVSRLNECLQFERKLAEAKEHDLLAELAKCKKALEEYRKGH